MRNFIPWLTLKTVRTNSFRFIPWPADTQEFANRGSSRKHIPFSSPDPVDYMQELPKPRYVQTEGDPGVICIRHQETEYYLAVKSPCENRIHIVGLETDAEVCHIIENEHGRKISLFDATMLRFKNGEILRVSEPAVEFSDTELPL